MDVYTATEIAYKNGYAEGKKDAVIHSAWCYNGKPLHCEHCGFEPKEDLYVKDDYSNANFCSNCGAKMDA